jgi:vitamin-K-epoxide reductase (warfarin-sensitive)
MKAVMMFLAAAGIAVSVYAYMVERKIKQNPMYKPACDISDRISCSKPITSEYSALFGVSNALLGIVAYAVMFVAALFGWATVLWYGAIALNLSSVVFAYLLYVKVKAFCVVCTLTYVINFLMLLVML